jgi:hypothetical protein
MLTPNSYTFLTHAPSSSQVSKSHSPCCTGTKEEIPRDSDRKSRNRMGHRALGKHDFLVGTKTVETWVLGKRTEAGARFAWV